MGKIGKIIGISTAVVGGLLTTAGSAVGLTYALNNKDQVVDVLKGNQTYTSAQFDENMSKYQERINDLESDNDTLFNENNSLREENDQVKAENNSVKTENNTIKAENLVLQHENSEMSEQNSELLLENDNLLIELGDTRVQLSLALSGVKNNYGGFEDFNQAPYVYKMASGNLVLVSKIAPYHVYYYDVEEATIERVIEPEDSFAYSRGANGTTLVVGSKLYFIHNASAGQLSFAQNGIVVFDEETKEFSLLTDVIGTPRLSNLVDNKYYAMGYGSNVYVFDLNGGLYKFEKESEDQLYLQNTSGDFISFYGNYYSVIFEKTTHKFYEMPPYVTSFVYSDINVKAYQYNGNYFVYNNLTDETTEFSGGFLSFNDGFIVKRVDNSGNVENPYKYICTNVCNGDTFEVNTNNSNATILVTTYSSDLDIVIYRINSSYYLYSFNNDSAALITTPNTLTYNTNVFTLVGFKDNNLYFIAGRNTFMRFYKLDLSDYTCELLFENAFVVYEDDNCVLFGVPSAFSQNVTSGHYFNKNTGEISEIALKNFNFVSKLGGFAYVLGQEENSDVYGFYKLNLLTLEFEYLDVAIEGYISDNYHTLVEDNNYSVISVAINSTIDGFRCFVFDKSTQEIKYLGQGCCDSIIYFRDYAIFVASSRGNSFVYNTKSGEVYGEISFGNILADDVFDLGGITIVRKFVVNNFNYYILENPTDCINGNSIKVWKSTEDYIVLFTEKQVMVYDKVNDVIVQKFDYTDYSESAETFSLRLIEGMTIKSVYTFDELSHMFTMSICD